MKGSSKLENLKTKIEISGHGHTCGTGCCGGGYFWGVFLLLIGLWFLAQELGWIAQSFSFWPVTLIVLGIWLLVKRSHSCSC